MAVFNTHTHTHTHRRREFFSLINMHTPVCSDWHAHVDLKEKK